MVLEKLTTTYSVSKFLIKKYNLTLEQINKLDDPKLKNAMKEILENENR